MDTLEIVNVVVASNEMRVGRISELDSKVKYDCTLSFKFPFQI